MQAITCNSRIQHDAAPIMRPCCLLVMALLGSLAAARASAREIVGAQNFRIVSRLTGSPSQNQTTAVGVGGTDLGHMVNHNGKTYFLFGDTFSGETPFVGGDWRHNAMAWSTDGAPANGITFGGWITNTSGRAREVIHSGIGSPITEIPTGAISLNNRIYAWYMGVNWWGPPGQWTDERSGLAYWSEGDDRFTNVSTFNLDGGSNFGMVAASLRSPLENAADDHVYLWGTPTGRFGGVKLARVLPQEIENLASYRFFDGTVNGTPTWTANQSDADYIVRATVGEMSVMYNEFLDAWTMLYFNEVTAAFEIRQSPTPWGDWSAAIRVAHSQQAPGGLYAPYMNPLLVENGGETLYFTMSLWNPYDVYLAKVTLNSIPSATLPGDFNQDGAVDAADLLEWRGGFGASGNATSLQGDADGDQDVDGADFLAWQQQLGGAAMLASSAAVPEPSSGILLLIQYAAAGALTGRGPLRRTSLVMP